MARNDPNQPRVGSDGLHLLMLEHHQLEVMYRAWRDGAALPAELRFRQACAFCCRMVVHSIVETQLFYRMLRVAGASEESADEASIEQLLLDEIIGSLVRAGPDDGQLEHRMHMLGQLLREHVQVQEHELFAAARVLRLDASALGMGVAIVRAPVQAGVLRRFERLRALGRQDQDACPAPRPGTH
jgi:hypothetical protein